MTLTIYVHGHPTQQLVYIADNKTRLYIDPIPMHAIHTNSDISKLTHVYRLLDISKLIVLLISSFRNQN